MDLKLKMGTGLFPQVHGKRQHTAVLPGFGGAQSLQPDRNALNGIPQSYVLFQGKPQSTAPKFGANLTTVAGFEERMMAAKGHQLFDFQREAMHVLEKGESVVVPAPTSSGKTLVAEYGMEDALVNGKKVFYTAPRKAISNEKYFEFCQKYGKENVGMMTGDVTVNPNAPIILMTTEILRNMLYQPLENRDRLKELQYVVFDECHFINDKDRGMVWEEAILYARRELPEVQQIHLSATVQNSKQYTSWLNSLNPGDTKAGKFSCINSDKRPVPLSVQYLSSSGTLVDVLDENQKPSEAFTNAFRHTVHLKKKHANAGAFQPIQTIQALKKANQLPLIEFVFGRKKCERYANDALLRDNLKLTTEAEKAKINKIVNAYIKIYPSMAESQLVRMVDSGIAYHHADMYIREKEMVEVLLKEGLLKVVFATSTLAEGVNVPAQTVGLSALDVYLPTGWRPISESEYQQATGRAGRLGWYQRGYAVLSHPADDDIKRVVQLVQSKPNPVLSQFKITPYQALNFVSRMQSSQIEGILGNSFKTFQANAADGPQEAPISRKKMKKLQREAYRAGKDMPFTLSDDFKGMIDFLKDAGFLKKDGVTPTQLGRISAEIPLESSLLIAKAVEEGLFEGLSSAELAALVSATVSSIPSPEQKDDSMKPDIGASTNSPILARKLREMEELLQDLLSTAGPTVNIDTELMVGAVDTVANWARTNSKSLLDDSPGLLTYTILRTGNMLKHLSEAEGVSSDLRDTAVEAREMLMGGVVQEQVQPKKVEIEGN